MVVGNEQAWRPKISKSTRFYRSQKLNDASSEVYCEQRDGEERNAVDHVVEKLKTIVDAACAVEKDNTDASRSRD